MRTPGCRRSSLLKCIDFVGVPRHHPELGNRLSLAERLIDHSQRLTLLREAKKALVHILRG